MKRRAPWQARRIATAKALRELPKCETEGCEGRQLGGVWGDESRLCSRCASKKIMLDRLERKEKAAPRPPRES